MNATKRNRRVGWVLATAVYPTREKLEAVFRETFKKSGYAINAIKVLVVEDGGQACAPAKPKEQMALPLE